MFSNLIFLSIGVLLQKKIVQSNPNVSLFVIVFYIYFSGFLMTIIIFNVKYFNDVYNPNSAHNTLENFRSVYFDFSYIRTLMSVSMIYISLILAESFRYITLLYINKMGHISKVTLYSGLHGFYVVIIWMIFEGTIYFDYIFVLLIIIAYCALFFSKYSLARILKVDNSQQK